MSDEKDLGFKVSDRRLFNPDGTPREIEPESAPSAPAQPEAPAAGGPPAAASGPQFTREPATEAAAGPDAAFGDPGGHEEDEMTEFMAALMNIASPAFIYLGLADHPATGRPQIDLGAAQQYIEILAILREKTKGNLTRSEEDFFEGILADMRMQFVALKNQGLGARG
jgi:hypothetical protein